MFADLRALREILVFGGDHSALSQGMAPNRAVFGFAQANLAHRLGVITRLTQPMRQGRR